jgi:hypothetical protein
MLNALRPLLLLAVVATTLPAAAQDSAAPPPIEIRSQREDAGARVRQVERSGGRVLQAEPMQRGGREVYRFKVLTPEGRVRVVQGDPRDVGADETRRPVRPARLDPNRGPAFDRREELTARRRDFRNDAGAEAARPRDSRETMRVAPAPAPRPAGDPAGN